MAGAGRIIRIGLTLIVLALATLVAVPAMSGRPLISYASSGSMEPTIGVFDGFLVDPWPDTLGPGDIVVFHSISRDTLAVHRIVATDGNGWITRGDANAGPDQDAGEPTLTRERVLGKVITSRDGEPILIEGLGATILDVQTKMAFVEGKIGGPRQIATIGFLLLALTFAVPALFVSQKRKLPARMPMRARVAFRRVLPRGILGKHVALALALFVLASSIVSAIGARHDVSTTLIVLQDPDAADDLRATGPGSELSRRVAVGSLGFLPTVVIVDPIPDRIRPVEPTKFLGPNARAEVEVFQRAGAVVGLQEDMVPVWRYPAFLPAEAIHALHRAAPGSPYLALGAIIIGAGAVCFSLLRIRTLPVARTLGIQEDWL